MGCCSSKSDLDLEREATAKFMYEAYGNVKYDRLESGIRMPGGGVAKVTYAGNRR